MSVQLKFDEMEKTMKKELIKSFKMIMAICAASCIYIPNNINAMNLNKTNDKENVVVNYEYKKNEYLSLKESINKLENELLNSYSTNNNKKVIELKELNDQVLEYKNMINELKYLDESYFETYNYSDDQINAIRNYDGSEEMTIKAASYVYGNLNLTDFRYNSSSNTSYISAKTTATWIGRPLLNLKDKLATALIFGDGNTIPVSRICYGTYQPSNGNEFKITLSTRMDNPALLVCDLPSEQYHSIQQKTGSLSKAELYFSAEVSGDVRTMVGRSLYLRQNFQVDDSIGISLGYGGGSASFGVSLSIDLEYNAIWDTDWTRKTR